MLVRGVRWAVSGAVFALAFVINPAYVAGCGSGEEGPRFGEEDMLAVLDSVNEAGAWQFETDNGRHELRLSLMQTEGGDSLAARGAALLARRAHACGSRTFRMSASACTSITTMPLRGALSLVRLDGDESTVLLDEVDIQGDMIVASNILSRVEIMLTLDEGAIDLYSTDAVTFAVERVDLAGAGTAGGALHFER